MKTRVILIVIFTTLLSTGLLAQAPASFHYQACLRENGTILQLEDVNLKLTILQGTDSIPVFSEIHEVTSSEQGIINVTVGSGQNSLGSLQGLDWSNGPVFLKVELDREKDGSFLSFGISQLVSVPYALYAEKSNTDALFTVAAKENYPSDSVLFQVKDAQGNTVFAVYNDGVEVTLDPSAKGGRGGFAVGGRPGKKGSPVEDIMLVTPDSVRIFINDYQQQKGGRGGFAVGGRPGKGGEGRYVDITPHNYCIGHFSGRDLTTGMYNSFMGYHSGMSNTTGSSNVFLGYASGETNTNGGKNTFLGHKSGYSNKMGSNNVFIGDSAGYENTGGIYNVFVGSQTGIANSSGKNNVFLGFQSGCKNDTGSNNVFIGYRSGALNTGGMYNTFMGYRAGEYNTTGSSNLFLGYTSGMLNTDGSDNLFIGHSSGINNISGSSNIFIGSRAGLHNTSGSSNIFIGIGSGAEAAAGGENLFVGTSTGTYNSGSYNVGLGINAGCLNAFGSSNTFVGHSAGFYSSSGNNNVCIGKNAGINISEGNGNICIGFNAGYFETGSNKLYISNTLSVDSTSLIYGDFTAGELRFHASVGINRKPDNQYSLAVGGKINATDVISSSDRRFKTNIEPISAALEKIEQLQGISYSWNTAGFPGRNFDADMHYGFIAQDVQQILPNLVQSDTEGYLGIAYEKITPLLVEAVKEQQQLIHRQEEEIQVLKKQMEMIIDMLKKQ